MLLSGDPTTYEIALRSLRVAATALAISLVVGVPLGTAVALNRFPLRRFVVAGVNTGMGVPPVTGCSDADLNQSNTVDASDLALFRKCLSGAGIAGNANCTK